MLLRALGAQKASQVVRRVSPKRSTSRLREAADRARSLDARPTPSWALALAVVMRGDIYFP